MDGSKMIQIPAKGVMSPWAWGAWSPHSIMVIYSFDPPPPALPARSAQAHPPGRKIAAAHCEQPHDGIHQGYPVAAGTLWKLTPWCWWFGGYLHGYRMLPSWWGYGGELQFDVLQTTDPWSSPPFGCYHVRCYCSRKCRYTQLLPSLETSTKLLDGAPVIRSNSVHWWNPVHVKRKMQRGFLECGYRVIHHG